MADETPQPENTPASSWPADPAAPAQPAPDASSIPVEPGPATPAASESQAPPADPSPAETAAAAPPADGGEGAPAEPPVARPVVVDNFTRRDDNDALLGHWVDVIAGEYQGRFGAYEDDISHDPQTGYPDRVRVRTRDAEDELIVVAYADIRPSKRTGGR